MAEITIDGVTLQFSESAFTAAQWEQVASWVLNGGGEAAAENARIALEMAEQAAKSEANADEDANSAKSYAVGGTGTREGEDTDNAKYYCQQAHAIAGEGLVFSVNGQQADEAGNVTVTKENIGAAAEKHSHSASDIASGLLPLNRGGTGTNVDLVNAPANAIIKKASDGFEQLYYTATGNGAFYATEENGAPKFGTLPLAQGGTGTTSLAYAPDNAIVRKVMGGNYLYYTATGNGAFFATAENGLPKFGTLPVAQGGTGATTSDAARKALNAIAIDRLWSNASYTSSFAAQTLELGLSSYDMYVVVFRYSTSVAGLKSVVLPCGWSGRLDGVSGAVSSSMSKPETSVRNANYASGNLQFGDATFDGVTSNNMLIPVRIYGIKGVI